MKPFSAFRIYADNKPHTAQLETIALSDLSEGEVIVRVHYSSVNYKDAIAGTGAAKILRRSPLVGGIDLAGVVEESTVANIKRGDAILVNGSGLSETHDGGYAQYARLPASWVIPLSANLTLEEAMIIGTAGFTVGLAIQRLEDNHQIPTLGPMVVTGATGGVGSFAVDILSKLGYEVIALTGKRQAQDYLLELGAAQIVDRNELQMGTRVLEKAQWGGAIDNVGGTVLSWLTRTVCPWGNIISVGMAGGAELQLTTMPFIIRGVSLIGVTSANCPVTLRHQIWQRLGADLKPQHIRRIHAETIELKDLPKAFDKILQGKMQGRVLVKVSA